MTEMASDSPGGTTTTLEELECELVGLAGRLAAGQCRFLLLLAEFDVRDGWAGPGLRSCAHWLSWRVGMDLRTAQEQLRVARALVGLPRLAEAFAAGRLSYSKIRALTRIATADTEGALLDLALAGTASHVERIVRLTRRAGADATAVAARRSARWDWDDDGFLVFRARIPAEQGAVLVAAVDALTAPAPRSAERGGAPPGTSTPVPGDPDEPRPGPDWAARQADRVLSGTEQAPGAVLDRVAARRADALIALAERAMPDSSSAVPSPTEPSAAVPLAATLSPAGRSPVGDEPAKRVIGHELVVHLYADTGAAEIENGPALPATTVQRIACSARVSALLVDRRGNPLYLGRRRRLASPTQLRALRARDRHRCRFPGCSNTRYLDAHHIISWLAGGPTDIDNLVLLCAFHHQLVHDRGYRIRWKDGDLAFGRPDGVPVPEVPAALTGRLADLVELRTTDARVAARSGLTPSWSGERMDPNAILIRLLSAPEGSTAQSANPAAA